MSWDQVNDTAIQEFIGLIRRHDKRQKGKRLWFLHPAMAARGIGSGNQEVLMDRVEN
jgi:hypothetical protein